MPLSNLTDPQLQALVNHYGLPLVPPQAYSQNYGSLTQEHYGQLLPTTMMAPPPQAQMLNPIITKPAPNIVFPQGPKQPYTIPLGNESAARGYARGQEQNAQSYAAAAQGQGQGQPHPGTGNPEAAASVGAPAPSGPAQEEQGNGPQNGKGGIFGQ